MRSHSYCKLFLPQHLECPALACLCDARRQVRKKRGGFLGGLVARLACGQGAWVYQRFTRHLERRRGRFLPAM